MTSITLRVAVDAVPGLLRRAVAAVPKATVVEIRNDGAVIGRRTNFAALAETTELSFHAIGEKTSRVDVEATADIGLFFRRQSGAHVQLMETAKAVIVELQRLAASDISG